MVFLIFAIAVLNLGLGFALAVHLGYGPPGILELWVALSAGGSRAEEERIEQVVQELASVQVECLLDDDPDDEPDMDFDIEAYDDDDAAGGGVAGLFHPNTPENWDLNEKYVETSLLKLNIAMIKSGVRATAIDAELRAVQGKSDRQTIHGCYERLLEDCESYLVEQSEAAEKFSGRIGELGELSSLGDEIERANLEQSAQVETTLSNLRHMDFESDLETANQRLLEEIGHLRVARHKLRDNQEVAFLAIAKYENRMEKIEKQLYNDPLTNLRNRIGLEATIWEWWQKGWPKSRQMNAVLFDLDAFGSVNEHHGSLVGDRILHHFASLIQKTIGEADLASRFAGQRFLALVMDVGPRTATKMAEFIRQTLKKTSFLSAQEEIHLTVGAGYTEVAPDDSIEQVVKRLEDALKKAKQTGPNCAFFHNGKETEAVDSPNLGAKPSEIRI